MPPVEMMAFTQDCRSVGTNSRTRVKNPISAARAVMGQRGREYVLARHTYPVLAKRFLDALKAERRDA